MNANIEALVAKHFNPYAIYGTEHLDHMRNALTEQAEAFKGELRAYDGMVRELTKTVEDMQAAQSVPVVGEPVAWGVTKRHEDTVWFISDSRFTAQHYANQYAHRIGSEPGQVVVPLYAAPTNSITAAELASLREKAAMADTLLDVPDAVQAHLYDDTHEIYAHGFNACRNLWLAAIAQEQGK